MINWAERPEVLQKTKIHENLIESLSIRSGSSFIYQIPLTLSSNTEYFNSYNYLFRKHFKNTALKRLQPLHCLQKVRNMTDEWSSEK